MAVPAPAPAPVGMPMSTMVAMAVGIVMHRFSLARAPALGRLQRLAMQEGRSLEQTSEAMVEALEQLALPGVL
jgi:response regulator NasT